MPFTVSQRFYRVFQFGSPIGAEDLLFGAAGRLSRCFHDRVLLAFANQSLRQERACRLRYSGSVLPMVLPVAAGSWTFTRRQLVNAAPVSVHDRAWRSVRAQIKRVWNSITVKIGRADVDILVNRRPGVGGIRGVIYDLEIAPERAVINDPLLKISELQRRALQAIGRIDDLALAVAVKEVGHTQLYRVA